MSNFKTGGIWGETNTSTQVTTGKAAEIKSELMAASPTYAEAVKKTQKAEGKLAAAKQKKNDAIKSDSYQNAKKKADESKKAYEENQQAQAEKENEISEAEREVEKANNELEAANEALNDKMDRIKELKEDGSEEALAAAKILEDDKTVEERLAAAEKAKEAADNDLKKKEDELEKLESVEDELEETMEKDGEEFEKENEKIEEIDDEIEDAESELDEAIVEENETLDQLSEEYPETIGKKSKEFQKVIDDDKQKAEKLAKEKAEKEQAIKDSEEWDKQFDKNESEIEQYGTDSDGLSLADFYDEDAAFDCKTKACLDKLLDDAKAKMESKRIIDLEDRLKNVSNPEEQAKIVERLKKAKEIPDVEKTLNEGIANSLFGGKPTFVRGNLIWDSPKGDVDMAGRLDNLIADHMQPKYKHAYLGEFPGKLAKLDWMVKSMDRPKIDVEYVEQLRNNVKRFYPVKYNYGDISFTFWDNVEHKTIKTIHEYFTGNVWQHYDASGTGFMLLRDSTVIPSLIVWDLSIDGEDNIKYIFENVSLSSFDFDANEDETDEGVHTIQAVFKFERYNIVTTKGIPPVLGNKSVTWL